MRTTLGGVEARATAPEIDAETEGALVHRARSGDADAWSEIYSLYYRPLFRYFLARVGDASITEDLTATVFLEAVKGIRSFSYNGTPLLAWLYKIARNVSADHYRRTLGRKGSASSGMRSRIPWLHRRSSDDLPAQEPVAPESAAASINDERLDLKQALAGLGEAQKEIIALHYYAGFSLREVARILGINERTVYSMQAKALLDLRKQLVA
jgi:RNA polymerase sigma-70 factor (ECF subfamily)